MSIDQNDLESLLKCDGLSKPFNFTVICYSKMVTYDMRLFGHTLLGLPADFPGGWPGFALPLPAVAAGCRPVLTAGFGFFPAAVAPPFTPTP